MGELNKNEKRRAFVRLIWALSIEMAKSRSHLIDPVDRYQLKLIYLSTKSIRSLSFISLRIPGAPPWIHHPRSLLYDQGPNLSKHYDQKALKYDNKSMYV
jgi:hypothetical protein